MPQAHLVLEALRPRETGRDATVIVARGRFSATFFAQCMVALGVKELQVPGKEDLDEATREHGAQALARNDRE